MSTILGNNPAVWNESELSPFNNFPVELFYEIFTKLRVDELKVCRQVCRFWNSTLMNGKLFTSRICTVYTGGYLSPWEHIKRDIKLLIGKSHLLGNRLRIRSVLVNDFYFLKTWLALSKTDTVTSLELASCILKISDFTNILSKFQHLAEISLLYVKECPSFFSPMGVAADLSQSESALKKRLKKLDIRISCSWATNSRITGLINALATTCSNLESLHLECLDTGHPRIDLRGQYKTFLRIACVFLRRNSKTLREVSVITYDVEKSRMFSHLICQNSELPRMHSNYLFNKFLRKISRKKWIFFINLRKLCLKFRLALIDEAPLFQTAFLPFLKKMIRLKQFELSQLYTRNENDLIRNIRENLPLDCRCHFELLSRVRPAITLSMNRRDLNSELNRIIGKSPNHLLQRPNSAFPKDLAKGILGYYDSTLHLETSLIAWTILYSKWKSIVNVNFFTQNLVALTKIKIHQFGVLKSDKIKINDADIQMIFQSASQLTHLDLKYCNMSQLTDFGLTGISSTACRRMLETKNYNLKAGDLIGYSICHLKYLRVLKLIGVGLNITDISAYHGFGTFWQPRFKIVEHNGSDRRLLSSVNDNT